MTTITTQQQPKSIATLPSTLTNTSPETETERGFLIPPARLRMQLEHLLLEKKNTTASNSDCLQASENMMHFHKRIFIQALVGLSTAQLADLNYVRPRRSEIIQ